MSCLFKISKKIFYLKVLNPQHKVGCAVILRAMICEQNGGQIYAPKGFKLTTTPFARHHADAFESELHRI